MKNKLNNAMDNISEKLIEEAAVADRLEHKTARIIRNIAVPVVSAAAVAGLCFGLAKIGVFGRSQGVDLINSGAANSGSSASAVLTDEASDKEFMYYLHDLGFTPVSESYLQAFDGTLSPDMIYADEKTAVFTDGANNVFWFDFNANQITHSASLTNALNQFKAMNEGVYIGDIRFVASSGGDIFCCFDYMKTITNIATKPDGTAYYHINTEDNTLKYAYWDLIDIDIYGGISLLGGEYQQMSDSRAEISGTDKFVFIRYASNDYDLLPLYPHQEIELMVMTDETLTAEPTEGGYLPFDRYPADEKSDTLDEKSDALKEEINNRENAIDEAAEIRDMLSMLIEEKELEISNIEEQQIILEKFLSEETDEDKKAALGEQIDLYKEQISVLTEKKEQLKKELAENAEISAASTEMLTALKKELYETAQVALAEMEFCNPVGSETGGILTEVMYGTHKGIDISDEYGTDILAAESGTVTLVDWNDGYGYCVKIDHGNNISTLYGHLNNIVVNAGDRVEKGQAIAKMGDPDMPTDVYLHFELISVEENINPVDYLPDITNSFDDTVEESLDDETRALITLLVHDAEAKERSGEISYPEIVEGGLRFPLDNEDFVISCYFGNDTWRKNFHDGLDITAEGIEGATVYSAADGTVIAASDDLRTSYGRYVLIYHGNGLATLYSHLKTVGAEVGSSVSKGGAIATVGNTGWSTGPHLHFEVIKNGTSVDPYTYLENE